MQPETNDTIDGGLGAVHEAIQSILERTKPKALVDEIGPLHLQLPLAAQHIGGQGQAFQFLVGLNQQQKAGRFVDLPGFDPHHTVLDHVETADAMGARQAVGFTDQGHRVQLLTVDRHRIACFKGNLDLFRGIRSRLHRSRHRKHLLRRSHHRVFKGSGFNAAAQQIEIDRVGRLLAHRCGQTKAFAVGDGLLTAHAPLTGWGEHLEVRCQRSDGHIETHLIIALACASMGDSIGTHFPGHFHQALRDQRPRQGRGEGVTAFVKGVGTNRRKGEILDKRLDQISHQRLTGTGIQRFLTNRLQLIALAEISGKGDHILNTPFLLEVWDADTGIHSPGIGEYHLLGAAHQWVS